MAAGKQTPRQRLIGLMYLVFLALMALNVSVEVLDSFPLINRGIEETNRNFENKVDMVYDDFQEQQLLFSEGHVQPYYGQAQHIRQQADSLVDFILTHRTQMLAEVNGISYEEADTMDLIDSRRKDNYSISSRYWLIEDSTDPEARDGGPGTRAHRLKENIINFKHSIDSILDLHDQSIQIGLDVEGSFQVQDHTVNWQQLNFDRVISVAVATNLQRMVTEVRNAQFDAVNMLYGMIHAGDFSFDEIAARVVPQSQIVMEGDHYEADVFVAAYDTRQDPEVIVDGIGRIPVSDGVGRLRVPASSPGTHSQSGVIRVTSPAGVVEEHRFETEYTVEKPMATVSADKMNVFYIGLDNPVSISAPGVSTDNLRPSVSSGAELIRQDDGSHVVRVEPGTTEVTVSVNAIMDGETMNMGVSEFRARTVPDPVAYIAGKREGRVDRQLLVAAGRITATMDRFEFDMSFDVGSFEMTTVVAGEFRRIRQDDGAALTDEMIRVINNARSGQEVTFRGITTRPGPDGTTRNLGAIALTIN
ncbi:MAG: gliding motility protein GldM [Bacteroidales bacterium]